MKQFVSFCALVFATLTALAATPDPLTYTTIPYAYPSLTNKVILHLWGDSLIQGTTSFTSPPVYIPPFYGLTSAVPLVSVTNHAYGGQKMWTLTSNFWYEYSLRPAVTNEYHIFWGGHNLGPDTMWESNSIVTNALGVWQAIAPGHCSIFTILNNANFNTDQSTMISNLNGKIFPPLFGPSLFDIKGRMIRYTNDAYGPAQMANGMVTTNKYRWDYIHFTPFGYMVAGTNFAAAVSNMVFPAASSPIRSDGAINWGPVVTNGMGGVRLAGTFGGTFTGDFTGTYSPKAKRSWHWPGYQLSSMLGPNVNISAGTVVATLGTNDYNYALGTGGFARISGGSAYIQFPLPSDVTSQVKFTITCGLYSGQPTNYPIGWYWEGYSIYDDTNGIPTYETAKTTSGSYAMSWNANRTAKAEFVATRFPTQASTNQIFFINLCRGYYGNGDRYTNGWINVYDVKIDEL